MKKIGGGRRSQVAGRSIRRVAYLSEHDVWSKRYEQVSHGWPTVMYTTILYFSDQQITKFT